ncbi:MAG: hypothetical protein ACK47P_19780, partial [Bradyrhizobium sp.]
DDLPNLMALAGHDQRIARREAGDPGADRFGTVPDLAPGDALVVAGKGHEVGQIVGGTTLPFSDHEAVAKALAEEGA